MDKSPSFTCLHDRGLITVTGEDAEHFLQNLITTDVAILAHHEARAGALLSPQGKVMFDFLVSRLDNGFLLDLPADLAPAFAKKLSLYKLHAKIEIMQQDESVVGVFWDFDSAVSCEGLSVFDLRFPKNCPVKRVYHIDLNNEGDRNAWNSLRITYGIAESGTDFTPGDVFPHDIAYDQIGGVSFKKGCYIGQEVVSRMHHRATARRRPLIATSKQKLPPTGTSVQAGEKPLGILGTVVGNQALAIARLDRVKAAEDQNIAMMANNIALSFSIPATMSYTFPDSVSEDD